MMLQPPNAQIPIVDQSQRATVQFLKFLGDLCRAAAASLDARVTTLEGQTSTLLTDVTTIDASITTLNTTTATHTAHLALLPDARFSGSTTYNPPNILALGTTTKTVTVIGASLGMAAEASFSLDITGLMVTAYVDSAGSVTTVWFNPTALAIDIASGTLRAYAWSPA